MLKKILIIEDDPNILEILGFVFTTDVFEPVLSSRLLSVEKIEELLPDVVLLDHWLGEGLGGDLCMEIKSNPVLSKTPVIMLSAHHYLSGVAKDYCADGYVEKPFDIYLLYDYVQGFCK